MPNASFSPSFPYFLQAQKYIYLSIYTNRKNREKESKFAQEDEIKDLDKNIDLILLRARNKILLGKFGGSGMGGGGLKYKLRTALTAASRTALTAASNILQIEPV